MKIDDIVLVDAATGITHRAVRQPQAGIVIGTYVIEGKTQKYWGRAAANPKYKISMWVLQTSQANAETIVQQLLELSSNPAYQPVLVQWTDGGVTNLDGWYMFDNFDPDYTTIFGGKMKVTYDVQKVAPQDKFRAITFRRAFLSPTGLSSSITAQVGLPPGATTTNNTVSRNTAEGTAVVVAKDVMGAITNTSYIGRPGTVDLTRRCHAYDRNASGNVVPTATNTLRNTAWTEVYGPDHLWTEAAIITNGILMLVFPIGTDPQLWFFNDGTSKWVQAGNVGHDATWVQSVRLDLVTSEEVVLTAYLSGTGNNSAILGSIQYRLRRGMRHGDMVIQSDADDGVLIWRPAIYASPTSNAGNTDAGILVTNTSYNNIAAPTIHGSAWLSGITDGHFPIIMAATTGTGVYQAKTTGVRGPTVAAGSTGRFGFGVLPSGLESVQQVWRDWAGDVVTGYPNFP